MFCFIIFCFHTNVITAEVKLSAVEIESKAKELENIWNGEEIRRSILLYLKASQKWEEENKFNRATDSLRSAAKLNIQINQLDEVLRISNKALKLDRKNNNLDGEVKTLGLISSIYQSKSKISESEKYYKKALDLSLNASDEAKAYALFYAGKHNLYFASVDEAINNFEKALSLIEKSDDIDIKAHILLNLATSNAIKGNKKASLDYMNSAYNLWDSINNKRGIALANNGFGFTYAITNEKRNALKHYKLAKNEIPDGVDVVEKAHAYNGIGFINLEYGQLDLAIANTQKGLKLSEQANFDIGTLGTVTTLAQMFLLVGQNEQSQQLFKNALKLAESLQFNFHKSGLIEGLGDIDFINSKYDLALIKFEKALQIKKSFGIPFPRMKNKIGRTYEKKADLENARKYYELALKESRKIQEIVQVGESLYNLARLNLIEDKLDIALEHSEEAIEVTESLFKDVGNHNLRQSFFSNSYDRYELHINILMKLHERGPSRGYDLKALQTSEKARSRLMRENLNLSDVDLTLDADPKLVEKEKELNLLLTVKKEELTILLSKKDTEQEVVELNEVIAHVDDQLHSIKAELRETSPLYFSIKNSVDFDYTEFQNKILDKETVLLEFFFGKEKSYVWLIEKDQITSVSLPKSSILDNKLDNILKLIVSIEDIPQEDVVLYQKHLATLEISYWENANEISKILFGQFSDRLNDKRIIIVPDGKLRSFPVSALPLPDKEENTPFLLTNEIVYEPSASLLYLLKTKRNNQIIPQKDFLVFSDPIFSQDDERLKTQIKSFRDESLDNEKSRSWTDFYSMNDLDNLARLKASKKESKNIFQFYDQDDSKTLSDFDANRKNLLSENLQDYKVLHFATHGLFNEEVPELSGIVLSRFDEKGKKQNGLIWLQDIYEMKLSADLVVLSACDTGVGNEIKGEGLMSLTNVFLQVGAKSIISSRWKVDDNRTLELMSNFYQILAEENITPSKALQRAKIKMYQNPNNKFPFYWASFTLHGDFQNIPNLQTKFDYSKYIIFILLIFGLFILFEIIRKKVE